MKKHAEHWLCPECKSVQVFNRRLTDPKPKCRKCKGAMVKVPRDQSGGRDRR